MQPQPLQPRPPAGGGTHARSSSSARRAPPLRALRPGSGSGGGSIRLEQRHPQHQGHHPQQPSRGTTTSSGAGGGAGRRRIFNSPSSSSSQLLAPLTEPLSVLDVDAELWQVLDLCSDEELESVYNILHSASPFSPMVKSLVHEAEPALLELRGRTSLMHKIESRFRFLAASSRAVLRGARPSYRAALLSIRERLGVRCSANLATPDLEAELFVHILNHCWEYVAAEGDAGDTGRAAAAAYAADADGMASGFDEDILGGSMRRPSRNWTERLTAPLRFGLGELLPSAAKLGSALAVSTLGRKAAERLGATVLSQSLRFNAAAAAALGSGGAATGAGAAAAACGGLAAWQRQAALAAAQRGLSTATARYAALRGALGLVGPVMWGWLAVDLAMAALGTDYARIIRAVFVLAQARLTRTHGWQQGSDGEGGSADSSGAWGSVGGGEDDDDDAHTFL